MTGEIFIRTNADTGFLSHPCTVFAKAAGYETWEKAVHIMRAGQIVQGPSPHIGKTMLDVDIFNREVASAGLRAEYFDGSLGLVSVGIPSSFK